MFFLTLHNPRSGDAKHVGVEFIEFRPRVDLVNVQLRWSAYQVFVNHDMDFAWFSIGPRAHVVTTLSARLHAVLGGLAMYSIDRLLAAWVDNLVGYNGSFHSGRYPVP